MDWRYNTIWFDQIQNQKQLKWNFKENKQLPLNFFDVEYATLWYYKYRGLSFETLPASEQLIYLEMNSANIQDFSDIGKFNQLKRLELHYCTKLQNNSGLESLKNHLEHLHINQSKKLQSIDQIAALTKLRVLCLNSCGPLENLIFLKDLPNLINFRFVDTNILDGDLSLILDHPSIRSVRFSNKRHYNYDDDYIKSKLSEKSTEEYQDFVYKEQYRTFKYRNYEGES